MENDRDFKGARTFLNWTDITKLNEWNCTSEWRLNTKTEQGQKYPKLHGISYNTYAS